MILVIPDDFKSLLMHVLKSYIDTNEEVLEPEELKNSKELYWFVEIQMGTEIKP
jgi:hypothetical protein